MHRLVIVVGVSLGWLAALGAGQASAQYPSGGSAPGWNRRPTVSPYMNLLRGGSTAVNYYNLVRPQIDYGKAIGQLQQDASTTQQALANVEASTALPTTGHRAQFMNYKRFFQTEGTAGLGSGNTSVTLSTRSASTAKSSPTTGSASRRSR